MFCGNCGKQIDNNSSFCPYCGASVNGNTGHKPKHKNDNKIKRIVVVALIVLAIAIVAIKGFAIYKSRPTEEQLLAEVNNYQNGGIVTSDGTWLYYNDNGLCKMLLKDGTKQKVLSNDINPEKMYLAGDQIYYFSNLEFYKTKVNKPKEEKLEFMSIFSEDGFQMDGNNYYYYETNSPEGVYSAKASNTKKKKMLTDILPTKILMYKDYLYVISGYTTIDDVENPTNVGAIFRSAAALNAEAVLLTEGCADPLYRRAARVSMGTVFQLEWTYINRSDLPLLKESGFTLMALSLADDAKRLGDLNLNTNKRAVVLGNEDHGISQEVLNTCDMNVIIPMSNGVDSLNVASASAVAFWEIF